MVIGLSVKTIFGSDAGAGAASAAGAAVGTITLVAADLPSYAGTPSHPGTAKAGVQKPVCQHCPKPFLTIFPDASTTYPVMTGVAEIACILAITDQMANKDRTTVLFFMIASLNKGSFTLRCRSVISLVADEDFQPGIWGTDDFPKVASDQDSTKDRRPLPASAAGQQNNDVQYFIAGNKSREAAGSPKTVFVRIRHEYVFQVPFIKKSKGNADQVRFSPPPPGEGPGEDVNSMSYPSRFPGGRARRLVRRLLKHRSHLLVRMNAYEELQKLG
jgi:hypothetical protein